MKKQKTKSHFVIGEKQRAAVKMKADGNYTWQEIANTLGVNRSTVWRWLQHKELERYYDRYELRRFRKLLRAVTQEEDQKMKEMEAKLDSRNPWEANRAACWFLDRYPNWL